MPLYRKAHSRGEFVFDFSWANAYAQHGLAYYPKLLSAVPFTPVRGPRLLTGAQTDQKAATGISDPGRDRLRAQRAAVVVARVVPD